MRVTVTTELVGNAATEPMLSVSVVVPAADGDLLTWLAGSCKTTLFKFINAPQQADGKTLRYRTTVHDGDVVVSDTGWAEFDGLSNETAEEFQSWAMQELSVMLQKLLHGRSDD